MKKTIFSLLIIFVLFLSVKISDAQVKYYYTKPAWTVGIGGGWNLATNDAYGRANYSDPSQVLYDNYGMRWGYGGYINAKYGPGKKKNDRIFLGFNYGGMKNTDMDSRGNRTVYDLLTFDAGYEYLFYGTYGFRSYYGIGVTGNIISGNYDPVNPSATDTYKSFESSFRVGMELTAGLEFILNTSKKNLGITVGGKYNLVNLFNDQNGVPSLGQTENLNWNDGEETGGPGFKRYIGIGSITVGLNIYPDVKRKVRK